MNTQNGLAFKAMNEEFTGEIELDIQPEEIIVETEDDASTALRLVGLRDREIERLEGLRQREVERINSWTNIEIEKIQRQKSFFLQALETFMLGRNLENEKVKSVKFPNGTIGLRKNPDRIEIAEGFQPDKHPEDKFVKSVVKTVYSVDKAAIKEAVQTTGECPEYASLVPGEVKFYYKLPEADNAGTE